LWGTSNSKGSLVIEKSSDKFLKVSIKGKLIGQWEGADGKRVQMAVRRIVL